MKKYLLLAVTLITLLGSCSKYKQIEIENVNPVKFKMVSLTKADLYLDLQVNNPTRATFRVTDAQGEIFSDGVEFATVRLYEEFKVPPGQPSMAQARLRIDITDPLALITKGLGNLENFNPDGFVINGFVTVKGRGVAKSFKLDDIPLAEFVKMLKV